MKLDELFPVDREQKINGTKHTLHEDGTYVVVAAWLNPLHARALNRVRRGSEEAIDEGRIELDAEDRLACRAMARGVLRGWGGPDLEPYSEDAAEEALFQRLGFRTRVIELAQAEAKAERQEEDEAGKG